MEVQFNLFPPNEKAHYKPKIGKCRKQYDDLRRIYFEKEDGLKDEQTKAETDLSQADRINRDAR